MQLRGTNLADNVSLRANLDYVNFLSPFNNTRIRLEKPRKKGKRERD